MSLKLMVPFLSKPDVKRLAILVAQAKEDNYDGVSMNYLLPFLNTEDLLDVAIEAKKNNKDVAAFFAFMLPSDIKKLIKTGLLSSNELGDLTFLLDKDDIDQIIKKKIAENDFKGIIKLLPFANKDSLADLMIAYAESGKDPYFFYPFVKEEALGRLLNEINLGKVSKINLSILYPFLSSDDIKNLFEAYLKKKGKSSTIIIDQTKQKQ